jgi:hypothetical protein
VPFRPRKKKDRKAKRSQCKRCGGVLRKNQVRCKKCSEQAK